MIFSWPIAIHLEPDREWEGRIYGDNIISAVTAALKECAIEEHERLHVIHVGPARTEKAAMLNETLLSKHIIKID